MKNAVIADGNDMNVVYYALKVGGQIIGQRRSTIMEAQTDLSRYLENQELGEVSASIVKVTADGKELLFG